MGPKVKPSKCFNVFLLFRFSWSESKTDLDKFTLISTLRLKYDRNYGEQTDMLSSHNLDGSTDALAKEIGKSRGAYIIRIPFGPKDKYIPKEALCPHIPAHIFIYNNSVRMALMFIVMFCIVCRKQKLILLSDIAHIKAIVAAGVIPSPFEYTDVVPSYNPNYKAYQEQSDHLQEILAESRRCRLRKVLTRPYMVCSRSWIRGYVEGRDLIRGRKDYFFEVWPFNAMFEFYGGWQKDASSTKTLAFEGMFISLYTVALYKSQILLFVHVKKGIPSSWEHALLAIMALCQTPLNYKRIDHYITMSLYVHTQKHTPKAFLGKRACKEKAQYPSIPPSSSSRSSYP
ncbi:membrane attack complex component/perforin (MACPF) domain-containing protein [Artemisia annua]|uniref:Membrane attack complex component/perforin (MACPF) domain-containing protein n=1 Tax=Artemisia annua TaxID=35608 RepID=A0A2U1NMX9_ARTAN|nr:membrane attack complex component/perforin (MACPF) domain-containing protein [Artemisia annua]